MTWQLLFFLTIWAITIGAFTWTVCKWVKRRIEYRKRYRSMVLGRG